MGFQPQYSITPLMLRQLKAIESARGFLDAVRQRDDWAERLRREARVRDALASVRIEGNPLTFRDAFELLDAPAGRELRDHEREFLNYIQAFDDIDGLLGDKSYALRRSDLLHLHSRIVSGVRGGDRMAGRIRREQVYIGDVDEAEAGPTIHHTPPPAHEVEAHVDDLLDWIERTKQKPSRQAVLNGKPDPWVHPVIQAGIAQHRMAWIHPFIDGNGRTARMFTTLLLYQRGYDFKLLFDLSSYYDSDRDAYYEALRTVDRTGDYTHWLVYFMGGFAKQMFVVRAKALEAAQGLESSAGTEDDDA